MPEATAETIAPKRLPFNHLPLFKVNMLGTRLPKLRPSVVHTHRADEGDWLSRQRACPIGSSRTAVILLIQQVIDIELRG